MLAARALRQIRHCRSAAPRSSTSSRIELSRFWTRETLIEYLHDPVGYRERDERLRGGKQYMLPMPRVLLDEELRGRLADYVLGF